MADENGAPKRLTLEDPVDPSVITHLDTLHGHWMNLSERLTLLEQEKIQILAALKRIDDEKHKIFEQVQIERGVSPDMSVSIDPKTRLVEVLNPPAKVEEPAPPAKVEEPAP